MTAESLHLVDRIPADFMRRPQARDLRWYHSALLHGLLALPDLVPPAC